MASKFFVIERQPRWAIALRQTIGEGEPRVHELRVAEAVGDELLGAPQSILLWAADSENALPLAARIVRLGRTFPHAPQMVAAERTVAHYEPLWREAGAIHVVTSPRKLEQVVRIVNRHLARVTEPARSLEAAVWAGLPWPPDEIPYF